MTEQEQRIAIWESCPEIAKGGYVQSGMPMKHIAGDYFKPWDALCDLNAMHEAEKTLKPMGGLVFHDYTANLLSICEKNGTHTYCATAAKRAEAFLRTIGRWKD